MALYKKFIPIISVVNLDSEIEFYMSLGFNLDSKEENFAGIKFDRTIEFGLQKKEIVNISDMNRNLTWQIEVEDVGSIYETANNHNLSVTMEPTIQNKSKGIWVMQMRTPNGYNLFLLGKMETQVEMPADFKAFLEQNSLALEKFNSLQPTKRKDFVRLVENTKGDDDRTKAMLGVMSMILQIK